MKIKLDKKSKKDAPGPGPGTYEPDNQKLIYHNPSWK